MDIGAASASTGRYASGYSKGKPRVPERMMPNSMCLLTECVNGKKEERNMIGAFAVSFYGGAPIGFAFSFFALVNLKRVDIYIKQHAKTMEVYLEYNSTFSFRKFIDTI